MITMTFKNHIKYVINNKKALSTQDCTANPKKNKTINGCGRFLNMWFSRTQNNTFGYRQNKDYNVNYNYKAKIKEF